MFQSVAYCVMPDILIPYRGREKERLGWRPDVSIGCLLCHA